MKRETAYDYKLYYQLNYDSFYTAKLSIFKYSPHGNVLPVGDCRKEVYFAERTHASRKGRLLRREDTHFAESTLAILLSSRLYGIIICEIYFILHYVATYQSETANFMARSLSACTNTRFAKSGRTKTLPSGDLPLHNASPVWILCSDLFLKVSNFLSLRSCAPSSTTKDSTARQSRASKNESTIW